MSGLGGEFTTGRNIDPLVPFEMPSYGGGIYCAAESTVTFTDCTFEDNITSEVDPQDPNFRLDPYIGYGGGVCAENSATLVFVDCNVVENQADSGGGIYINSASATVIDCNVASNTALRGGGFLGANDAIIDMMGCNVTNNIAATDVNDPNDDFIVTVGAGLGCWSSAVNIQDCNVNGNRADASGGGAYLRDVSGSVFNNLITNNAAGRDGGGISANWYSNLVISNCTFAGNAASGTIGELDETGYGGGFYCSSSSNCVVTDSIFWNNYALDGAQIAIGTGFEYDRRPATVTVSYSDIEDGRFNVWVDDGCTLNWGAGNIDANPLFVNGPLGRYYLSQTDAGQQQTSPCVNKGSDYVSHIGLIGYTTRTDEVPDTGIVDMGYHHPMLEPCRFCDMVYDGIINFHDFAILANRWLEDGCSDRNAWCQGTDLTLDTRIDMEDISFLADCWLVEDTSPPTPDPSRWEAEPYLTSEPWTFITMTAETAYDAWGWDVEYYFECVYGDCHNSGWQKSSTYADSVVSRGGEYGYRVKARDELGNETDWSEIRYAGGADTTPPAPAPHLLTIDSNSPTSVVMVATIAYDESGVEYYFESTSGGGHNSGWLDEPNYVDVGLNPDTEYCYRVRARDKSTNRNTTDWSDPICITTLVAPETIPPTPNPMEWDPVADANGVDGTPREVYGGGGSFDYWVEMRAVAAQDASGFVEYFFECTTESGFSSGWIPDPTYTVLVGRSGQGHRFRVKARDMYGNETAWSTEERAD